ncbi:uncharacterized protein LOC111695425 [Eurytemora carolleeae]|uniref:uncharacterized protein LOC111695425 n=1 Tax=Eurytemora carolleeae TaxID=1294199 RepID=UPI000C785EFB|nr:uncharacterized protein LOC111695425 [Eurytemora carolleeae]|eukprot:XP_023320517.1 uncharacterized protein LOC111695425 [Eurytemora affinis]
MHVYRGPFKFQVEPYTDYYNQFSSQERNIGEDIHSTGPSLESNEDEEFWWMFAALFVVICFLILLFGLSLQLLARAILRHNQNLMLKQNMEDYFSTPRNSKTQLIRSLSSTFPATEDDVQQLVQTCHCHGLKISV